ncbi:MAG: aminodeoxychorismate/anthranilate synthase component II [Eubacteriales bacterium]|jgi:anthranilate synthase component 2
MILLIDNYDSFSYNLWQLIGSLDPDTEVIRNDARTVAEIGAMKPECIILSPGPGRPSDAGVCEDVVRTFRGKIPLFGVCLGHQAISEAYGATVTYAGKLMHGMQSEVKIDTTSPLFRGMPEVITAGRYHSLAVKSDTLPPDLKEIAESDDNEVMAVADEKRKVYGLQFHPESIMTPDGKTILKNFLDIAGVLKAA